MKRRGASGFLLVELLVVLAIISVILGIGVSVWTAQLRQARDVADKSNATILAAGLESYYKENDLYPATCDQETLAPFMRRWPVRNGAPVREGSAPGEFSYLVDADRFDYELTMHLSGGRTYTLPEGIRPAPGGEQ